MLSKLTAPAPPGRPNRGRRSASHLRRQPKCRSPAMAGIDQIQHRPHPSRGRSRRGDQNDHRSQPRHFAPHLHVDEPAHIDWSTGTYNYSPKPSLASHRPPKTGGCVVVWNQRHHAMSSCTGPTASVGSVDSALAPVVQPAPPPRFMCGRSQRVTLKLLAPSQPTPPTPHRASRYRPSRCGLQPGHPRTPLPSPSPPRQRNPRQAVRSSTRLTTDLPHPHLTNPPQHPPPNKPFRPTGQGAIPGWASTSTTPTLHPPLDDAIRAALLLRSVRDVSDEAHRWIDWMWSSLSCSLMVSADIAFYEIA